ncbi:MAG TPA: class I SAM-dependent methyltransferase [Solirubrobacteraceae bacterium]|jgi:ubiquinone/menaquinone biosynthesis C-methylase UbiE
MTRDAGMRAYYDRRAPEYDDWWHGTGRFASRERPGWHEEVEALTGVLRALEPAATLDVACGTGFLTRHLPGAITAIDQSPAMVAVAAERLGSHAQVREADALALPFADGAFDRVHTGHFYGHLLVGERETFLAEARRVGRSLVITDSADTAPREDWQTRILDDGSTHQVYKRWFTGEALAAELGGGTVLHAGRWFVVVAA